MISLTHPALRVGGVQLSQRINRRQGWSGHLWQRHLFPSPLDGAYLWFCVRYVERNPVRAGMVEQAEDYPWSSAVAHCRLKKDPLLVAKHSKYWQAFESLENWASWLRESDDEERLKIVRRIIQKNLPCGSDRFTDWLEGIAEQALHFRPIGRPNKG